MRSFAVVVLYLMCTTLLRAADPAPVLECMRANIPEAVRIQRVELVAVDREGGERVLRGRLYASREDDRVRVMFRIEAPVDMAGAAFLLREREGEDDMYLYLPAIRRVRRVRGGGDTARLFGTDLSYDDIKQIQNAYRAGTLGSAEDGEIEGRAVHVLEVRPAEPEREQELLRLYVDRASCVVLRADFYDSGGLRRQLRVDPQRLRQVDRYWYAEQLEVRDLRGGTHTRVTVSEVYSERGLSGRYFNPHSFYIGG